MKRWLVVLLLVMLSTGLAGQAVAAAPPPGKGPPEFDKIVFVHYPKGDLPAKPGTTGNGGEGGYKYGRYRWAGGSMPVNYLVDLGGRPAVFLAGIQAGFQTWEDDPQSNMDFNYGGEDTIAGISSLSNQMNSINEIGWADISSSNPGAIAVTIYWYNVATKLVVEVDMALNTNGYAWWQNGTGDELWDGGDSLDYDVDVQNIVTHEAGHWLVLGDLYNANNSEQTMYGYSAEKELKKRSLNSGDIAGIRKIY